MLHWNVLKYKCFSPNTIDLCQYCHYMNNMRTQVITTKYVSWLRNWIMPSWLGIVPQSERLLVQFSVGPRACVAVSFSHQGASKRQPIDVCVQMEIPKTTYEAATFQIIKYKSLKPLYVNTRLQKYKEEQKVLNNTLGRQGANSMPWIILQDRRGGGAIMY